MWASREMRRKERAMPLKMARQLLEAGEYGVLATANADGVPLATPLSYVVLGSVLYFHCANEGQKLDNIATQPRVCFCVVGQNSAAFNGGHFTTLYESITVHGSAAIVHNDGEKCAALRALCQKYLPQNIDEADNAIVRSFAATTVISVHIDELCGKSNRQ